MDNQQCFGCPHARASPARTEEESSKEQGQEGKYKHYTLIYSKKRNSLKRLCIEKNEAAQQAMIPGVRRIENKAAEAISMMD